MELVLIELDDWVMPIKSGDRNVVEPACIFDKLASVSTTSGGKVEGQYTSASLPITSRRTGSSSQAVQKLLLELWLVLDWTWV